MTCAWKWDSTGTCRTNTGCVSGETEISLSRDFSKILCSKKKRAMTVQVSCLLSLCSFGSRKNSL